MKNLIRVSVLFLMFCGFSTLADAQDPMSEEKRKLIAEIIIVTKADRQFLDIMDKMLENLDSTLPLITANSIENSKELTAAQKKELAAEMEVRVKSFNRKFRERLPQKVDIKKFTEDLIYPIYDKFFTEKDLAELLVFYKSETGQKFLSITPQMITETNKITEKNLMPQVMALIEEIIKEEFPELSGANPKSPPAKKPKK